MTVLHGEKLVNHEWRTRQPIMGLKIVKILSGRRTSRCHENGEARGSEKERARERDRESEKVTGDEKERKRATVPLCSKPVRRARAVQETLRACYMRALRRVHALDVH
eukprot:3538803-Pleurochrysis_carterae.AAC.1